MTLLLILAVTVLASMTVTSLIAKYKIVVHGPTAVERRNHAAAINVLRDLILTPDALDLRDRAQLIVDEHDRASTKRKDT